MSQRHATFTFMTAVAETSRVVTTSTLSLSALRIQAVREEVIQIVNVAGQVVPAMALHASGLVLMTTDTPTALKSSPITVLVSPVIGMNILEGNASAVT